MANPPAPVVPAATGIPYGLFAPTPVADPLASLSLGFNKPAAAAFDSPHDNRINSVSATIDAPIPADIFDFWLDTLIALRGPDILRIKGIVHVEGIAHPFAFHGVQHIFHPPVSLPHWPAGDCTSRIVVIGRDIPRDILASSLQLLRMRPPPADGGGMMTQHLQLPF